MGLNPHMTERRLDGYCLAFSEESMPLMSLDEEAMPCLARVSGGWIVIDEG